MIVESLRSEFPHIAPDEVEREVRVAYDTLAKDSKAPSFLGILAERHARAVLARTTDDAS